MKFKIIGITVIVVVLLILTFLFAPRNADDTVQPDQDAPAQVN